jgi:hypothetical protein
MILVAAGISHEWVEKRLTGNDLSDAPLKLFPELDFIHLPSITKRIYKAIQ